MSVIKSAVLNDDRLARFELHCILCFEWNFISAHIGKVVHSKASYALCVNRPLDIFVRLFIHEEDRNLNFCSFVAIVYYNNALMSLEHSFTERGKLAIGDYPITFSYYYHIRNQALLI